MCRAILIAALAVLLPIVCHGSDLAINVGHDLVRMEIHDANAACDGQADDSAAIQAAIDHVAAAGGGMVFVPPGTCRIANVQLHPGVTLAGAGREQTILRALNTSRMLLMSGGTLRDLSVYGTPTADVSGDGWRITTKAGRGGTATSSHLITVTDAVDPVIENVRVAESRYEIGRASCRERV